MKDELKIEKVKPKKFVVVFVKINAEGKFDCDQYNFAPPYGCHHIIKFFREGDFGICATISATVQDIEKVKKIAEIIAEGVEVEIDPDFYKKYYGSIHSQR